MKEKWQVHILNVGNARDRLWAYGVSTLLKTFRIHGYRGVSKHPLIPVHMSTDRVVVRAWERMKRATRLDLVC